MHYVYVGRNEWVALVVGLITGTLYTWLNLPIPAPNVAGGIFAILFTYIGYLSDDPGATGGYRVNLGCVEGIDPLALEVAIIDGASLPVVDAHG